MSEATVPGCTRCGAPLPIDPTSASVTCAHCAQVHTVDPALRARMLAYVGGHARAFAAELAARFDAQFFENNRAATAPFVLSVMAFAIAFALWVGLLIAGEVSVVLLFGSLVFAWLALVMTRLSFRRVYRVPTIDALARFATVRCAGCGGWSAFAAGAAANACAYCGGHRLVPTQLATHALMLAEIEAARAGSGQVTAWERAVAAGDRWVIPLVVGSFAVVLLGGPALVVLELWYLADVWHLPALVGALPLLLILALEARSIGRAIMATGVARRALTAQLMKDAALA